MNTLTEAKLNEVRQERVSTVSMVEDFKTKNRNMFIDFKRLSDEKSDEISQELKTSFKYSLSGSGKKFHNSSCVQCTRIKIIHTTCYTIELPTNRLLFMIRVTSICEK